jgi:beta-glucosidase
VDVTVTVANTGERAGDEVVQMYVEYIDSGLDRPNRQLAGFRRVPIDAKSTVDVTLSLSADQLAYWSCDEHKFVVERGKSVRILVGRSSARIELSDTIDVI